MSWIEFEPTFKQVQPRRWWQFWKPKYIAMPPQYKMEYKHEGKQVHLRIKSKEDTANE